MSEMLALQGSFLKNDLRRYINTDRRGKIKTSVLSKDKVVVEVTLLSLVLLTGYGVFTFDYKDINLAEAITATMRNAKTVFFSPHLTYGSVLDSFKQLSITLGLGVLTTMLGAFIALFLSLLCARNIADEKVVYVVKGLVAVVRAVPTILWVLIFAVTAGLGSIAAVIGLSFHSASYLTKAYAESIEEMDEGTIEALKSSGAGFWQIVFQAILPSAISYMLAWTFMRFEINFTNAVAMGAAAGAGGVGFNLFMAGNFYFDLHEMGYFTYIIVLAVILLEVVSTKIKEVVR